MPLSNNVKSRLRLLGYYQMAGGAVGLVLMCLLLSTISEFTPLLLIVIVPAFLLFIYSIYCGRLLMKAHVRGIKHSLVNQYLQLFSFAISGYAFQYVAGVYLSTGIDLSGQSFNLLFGAGISSWQLNINTGEPYLQFNFNFVALAAIVLLVRSKNEMKGRQLINSFETPGLNDS